MTLLLNASSFSNQLAGLRAGGRSLAFAVAILLAGFAAPLFAGEATVNINTASAEMLSQALSGVGIAKAQRIVEYREAHGPFESVDELAEVNGIGPATVERNREAITLE